MLKRGSNFSPEEAFTGRQKRAAGTEDVKKKQQRIIANRHSARKSRAKKLAQISELEVENNQIESLLENLMPRVQALRERHMQLVRQNEIFQAQLSGGDVRGHADVPKLVATKQEEWPSPGLIDMSHPRNTSSKAELLGLGCIDFGLPTGSASHSQSTSNEDHGGSDTLQLTSIEDSPQLGFAAYELQALDLPF